MGEKYKPREVKDDEVKEGEEISLADEFDKFVASRSEEDLRKLDKDKTEAERQEDQFFDQVDKTLWFYKDRKAEYEKENLKYGLVADLKRKRLQSEINELGKKIEILSMILDSKEQIKNWAKNYAQEERSGNNYEKNVNELTRFLEAKIKDPVVFSEIKPDLEGGLSNWINALAGKKLNSKTFAWE